MKQQCYLAMVYLNWVLLVGGLVFFVYEHLFLLAFAWVVLLPLGRAVPVVEAGKRQLVGKITTEQLAELVSGISAP